MPNPLMEGIVFEKTEWQKQNGGGGWIEVAIRAHAVQIFRICKNMAGGNVEHLEIRAAQAGGFVQSRQAYQQREEEGVGGGSRFLHGIHATVIASI